MVDSLPEWAQDLLKQPASKQVSHGLNLALPLQRPVALPKLLWDIAAAQPTIRSALRELNFVHFARFVPSWDGTALMVVTSFDGPLEPYVLDFVIPLGEVFDLLLSYVDPELDPAPPRQVREDPDGFMRFVRHWNRVPLFPGTAVTSPILFPRDFDYPVFSAYPDKTVLDLVGPRTHLPPPAIDRPAAKVDQADVQENILRGYRAASAEHVMYRVVDLERARAWLANKFSQAHGEGAGWPGVSSAAEWPHQEGASVPPELVVQIGFTFEGLKALLPERASELETFPEAFKQGALKRAEGNFDVGESAPDRWLFGRVDQVIHVVVSLYTKAAPAAGLLRAMDHSLQWLRSTEVNQTGLQVVSLANGADRLHTQARPDNREAFGFRDDLSKPRINGLCHSEAPDHQPAASPGEFLLGKDYISLFGGSSLGRMPPDLATNGSFGALRLLEQDVDAFKSMVTEEAQRLGMKEDELSAKLMGRWQDSGEALSLAAGGQALPAASSKPSNAFDYAPSWEYPEVEDDHYGQRCPVGAHIRRVNPRSARVAGQRHSRRLVRRGMPCTWQTKAVDGEQRQGLLGLFICASLEHQFEFIQREWIHGDIAASGIRGEQDPIAGQRSTPMPFSLGREGKVVQVPPLVRTRGSLYLFFPSLSMLKGLHQPQWRAAASAVLSAAASDRADAAESLAAREALSDDEAAALDQVRRSLPELDDLLKGLRLRALPDTETASCLAALQHVPAPARAPPPAMQVVQTLPRDFVLSPFRHFRAWRAKGKAVFVADHQAVFVLDKDLVQALLGNPGAFVQSPPGSARRGILTADGPQHQRLRDAVAAAFRAQQPQVPGFVDAACDEALASIADLQQFDFVSTLGRRIPRQVFWQMFSGGRFGLDTAACDALAQKQMELFGQPAARASSDQVALVDSGLKLAGHLGEALLKAVAATAPMWPRPPRPPTILEALAARVKLPLLPLPGRDLGAEETLVTLVQIVLASMSMQFLLGAAAYRLLSPDSRQGEEIQGLPWDHLRGAARTAADLVTTALREVRRVEPPVTIVQRYAAHDGVRLAEFEFNKGDAVFAVVAAANRDAAEALKPEEFHWDRKADDMAEFSLGHGVHACVGSALQDLIVPAVLRRLLNADVLQHLRLSRPDAVPAWVDNVYFRDLRSLSVTRCEPGA